MCYSYCSIAFSNGLVLFVLFGFFSCVFFLWHQKRPKASLCTGRIGSFIPSPSPPQNDLFSRFDNQSILVLHHCFHLLLWSFDNRMNPNSSFSRWSRFFDHSRFNSHSIHDFLLYTTTYAFLSYYFISFVFVWFIIISSYIYIYFYNVCLIQVLIYRLHLLRWFISSYLGEFVWKLVSQLSHVTSQ